MPAFRIDIQALRGFAVLTVLFYHSGLFSLSGGYLGVDLFFVISGYLITSQIRKSLADDSFSFKAFYLRRAWRLLPAAYCVFFICITIAPWLLTQAEFADFRAQLIGAITFSANIVLWAQTGYFENAADLKPLLHTWSLSIEEQYYLVMPLLLAFFSKQKHFIAIALITLTSLALFVFFNSQSPGATFYLTPMRIWELGVGSILSFYKVRKIDSVYQPVTLIPLVVIVILCFDFPSLSTTPVPWINNIAAIIATTSLIAFPSRILESGVISKVLSWFGEISYSLYLIHWPIFAFIRSITVSEEETLLPQLALVLVSIVLAVLVNKYIERPNRITTNNHNRTAKPLILISVALIGLTFAIEKSGEKISVDEFYAANIGLSRACNSTHALDTPECRTHPKPNILVWGDSFAMHLIPALTVKPEARIMQATRSVCAPLTDLAVYNAKKYTRDWGLDCMQFNQHVLNMALRSDEIEVVILASPWSSLLESEYLSSLNGNQAKLIKQNTETSSQLISKNLLKVISELRKAGKRVVAVGPPPSNGFHIVKCYERLMSGLVSIGATNNCALGRIKSEKQQKQVNDFLNILENSDVPIYKFSEKLCDESRCSTQLKNIILYRDASHLSIAGSRLIGEKYDIYQDMMQIAR